MRSRRSLAPPVDGARERLLLMCVTNILWYNTRTTRKRANMSTEESPDLIVRGWRAWSIQRGAEHSSGSEQFEWRIKKTGSR